MTKLARGVKAELESGGIDPSWPLLVRLGAKGGDLCEGYCFGLNEAGRLISYDYMISSSQKSSPKGEVVYRDQPASGSGKDLDFAVDLSLLPAEARKLVFVSSLVSGGTMADAGELTGLVCQGPRYPGTKNDDFQIKKEGGAFSLHLKGSEFTTERAVIVLELYLEGVWRVAAVGSGYEGGIADLMSLYGPLDAGKAGQGLSSPAGTTASPLGPGASLSGSPADPSSSSIFPNKLLAPGLGGQSISPPGPLRPLEVIKGVFIYKPGAGPGAGFGAIEPSGSASPSDSSSPSDKPAPSDPNAPKVSPPPGERNWPPPWLVDLSDEGELLDAVGPSSPYGVWPPCGLGGPSRLFRGMPNAKGLNLTEDALLSMIASQPSNWDPKAKVWLSNCLSSLDNLKADLSGLPPMWLEESELLLRGFSDALLSVEQFGGIYEEQFRLVFLLPHTIYTNPSVTISTIDNLLTKINKTAVFFNDKPIDIIVDNRKLTWNPFLASDSDVLDTIETALESSRVPSHLLIDKISKEYHSSKVPVFVLFLTDGTIVGKKSDFNRSMSKCSAYPIFFHFLFTEKKHKGFLSNLARIKSKFISNWWYSMLLDSLDRDDLDFHRQILWKFPEWILDMRSKRLIR
jgi:stress response protein SCP2